MPFLLRRVRGEEGFTLVELVAAMMVFGIAAVAVLSVLVAGIRTAGAARDRTLAKDLAREKLEEMRRLPLYRAYAAPLTRKVDVLDFYFPSASGPTYDSVTDTYTCATQVGQLGCVGGAGTVGRFRYQMDVVSRFVHTDRSTAEPATTYVWNSATNDAPPTNLLDVEIEVRFGASFDRTFTLRSLVGEARLSNVLFQGSVDGSMVVIETGFSDRSTLSVRGGVATSAVFEGEGSTARNDTLAASAQVTLEDGSGPLPILGARGALTAPPDAGPLAPISGIAGSLVHPFTGATVATIGSSVVDAVTAKVVSVPQVASGNFTLANTGADDVGLGGPIGLTATNEVDGLDPRGFDTAKPFVALPKFAGRGLYLETSCADAGSAVTCRASGPGLGSALPRLRVFPVTFLSGASPPTNGYLVTVEIETISVEAITDRADAGGAVANVGVTGAVRYWTSIDGSSWIQKTVPIGGALPAPIDVQVGPTRTLADYVLSWSAVPEITTSISVDSREVQASLQSAFRMVTKPSNLSFESSGFIVAVGGIRAQAVDRR
ncbi:MAG: type IV pilus modification PilV family protein [Actinomycetota bacterium]